MENRFVRFMQRRSVRQSMTAIVISLAVNVIPMVVPYPQNTYILYLYAPGLALAKFLIGPGHDWQLVAIPVLMGVFNVLFYAVLAWLALEAYAKLRSNQIEEDRSESPD